VVFSSPERRGADFLQPHSLQADVERSRLASRCFVAFAAILLLTFILTPIVMVRGKSAIRKLSLHLRGFFLAGLIAGIAPVLGFTAFSLGFVGYVTTRFKLSTLFTLFWSSLFLKETRAIQRLPASIVMVTGIILITM